MNKDIVLTSIIFILIIVFGYVMLTQKPEEKVVVKVEYDTTYQKDTVTQYIPFDRLTKETIVVDSTHSINYDSLIAQAFEEWNASIKDTVSKTYVVKADTTLSDSLVTAEIAFYSPLPIHPSSYFVNKFTTKIPTITKTITIETTHTPLLTYGLSVSVGYGIITGKPDVYVGCGINLNFGKIF
jgi:hypothetical protein